jgi:ADP-ribosylglycohydrolase
MERARLSLSGLSVGDAFGEQFFGYGDAVEDVIARRATEPGMWPYTDDTEMALGVIKVLDRYGHVDQDELARVFAERFVRGQRGGYGATAQAILRHIWAGMPWREAAGGVFSGMGSMGNGAAMRVAPLGAYFADDYSRVVSEARLSAEVTHAHAEGQAGAIAVAAAAAFAWNTRKGLREDSGTQLLRCVLEHTPAGDTRRGIEQALSLSRDLSWQTAASLLGNGGKLSAPDTVPFCLWCAARHLGDYEVALWTTVAGLGDMDTNCAIVGGIVALSVGADSIPRAWLNAREPV